VKALHDIGAFFACRADEIELRLGLLAVRARAGEVIAREELFQGIEGDFIYQYVCGKVAQAQVTLALRVCAEPVGIRSLDAVHAPRVFRLGAVEKGSRGTRPVLFKVDNLQSV
jgi:hypothetical protein